MSHNSVHSADEIARRVQFAMQNEALIGASDDAKEVIDSAAAGIRVRIEVI